MLGGDGLIELRAALDSAFSACRSLKGRPLLEEGSRIACGSDAPPNVATAATNRDYARGSKCCTRPVQPPTGRPESWQSCEHARSTRNDDCPQPMPRLGGTRALCRSSA